MDVGFAYDVWNCLCMLRKAEFEGNTPASTLRVSLQVGVYLKIHCEYEHTAHPCIRFSG